MTVRITVRVMGALGPRRAATLTFPGDVTPSVATVVSEFLARYPELGAWLGNGTGGLRPDINVFVGRDNVRTLGGPATPVDPSRELWLVHPQAGG